MRARPALLVALLSAAGALAGGCGTVDRGGGAAGRGGDPLDGCRRAFAACAPPVHYRPDTDVAALDVRRLAHLASRIDVGGLSARAAKRLHKLAREGNEAAVLEIEAALEDSDAALGKCGCEEIKPDLDKVGVREVVRSRVPPRLMRSPETWMEWIVTRLATIRDLARLSAAGAAGGDTPTVDQAHAARQQAEKDLCETVHGARAMLPAESFGRMLEAVYLRRETDAGAGSAESARRTVGAYARSASCEAPPAPPAN